MLSACGFDRFDAGDRVQVDEALLIVERKRRVTVVDGSTNRCSGGSSASER